jgi:hypothetical protein
VVVDICDGVSRLDHWLLGFLLTKGPLEPLYQEEGDVQWLSWERGKVFNARKFPPHTPLAGVPLKSFESTVANKNGEKELRVAFGTRGVGGP